MTFPKETLDTLPDKPGVYLMKGKGGHVLYVGKAKVLKARVKQYFANSPDTRAMIPYLTAKVEKIDTIVTHTEKEALLLENTLIKKHKPKYNVFLKDDKTYISLMVTTKHEWPTVKLVRYKTVPTKDGKYFGPYTSAMAARETLNLLAKIFPLRECSDRELRSRKRPCLLYHIKRCIAPCVNRCSQEEYQHFVDQCVGFLQGKNQEILQNLKNEMKKASDEMAYEKAGAILHSIRQIEKVIDEAKSAVYYSNRSCDAIGVVQKDRFTLLIKLVFREGRLSDTESHQFSSVAPTLPDIIASFLLQHYEGDVDWPKEIFLPLALENQTLISQILTERKNSYLKVVTPQKGEKKAIVDLAMQNAKAQYEQERLESADQEEILLLLQELCHLNNLPTRIECFDTSNISRTDAVASMVVFQDGRKEPRLSRLYKIKSSRHSDDYSALKEVLERRYTRAKKENLLPDLIIMDGGKGQLNLALKILEELEIVSIDVIALVKEDARHDKGLTKERVYIKGKADPISIDSHSSLLFFLQTIRDEAHRRAITFHRKRRSKRLIHSILDEIPGIGPAKRSRLLKHFGSVEKIKEASLEEIKEVQGLTQNDAENLKNHLFP